MAKSQAAQHMAPQMPTSADDDIPRTFRREREAREREARAVHEREVAARGPDLGGPAAAEGQFDGAHDRRHEAPPMPASMFGDGVVTRLDIPFFRLMRFMVKAVLAGIPALLLLMGILWLAGQGIKTFAPSLLKAKIEITFPNG